MDIEVLQMEKDIKKKKDTVVPEEIGRLAAELRETRPGAWEDIPDIHLYKDQVIEIMEGQHIGFTVDPDESLTPAMINNYAKSGLMPRAKGKRYDRSHIAYLTIICMLKQILPAKDAGAFLSKMTGDEDSLKELYARYCSLLDEKCLEVSGRMEESRSEQDIKELMLELAVSSYVQGLACKRLTEILSTDIEDADGTDKDR